MSKKSQYKAAAKEERKWAADASRDEKYLRKRAKKLRHQGKTILARRYEKEASIAGRWAGKREKEADKLAEKGE
jgi:hypothetical protein